MLITAGPTHEPIDEVRYLGNRSSGRLGVAIADAAASDAWEATLLLGPTHLEPAHPHVRCLRFQTTADLESLLATHFPECDALIMAAAVADFRPRERASGKWTRGESMTLDLVPTPDLVGSLPRSGQVVAGFALEPRERLLASASRKLTSKRLDLIVANPLETMESADIDAIILTPDGRQDPGPMSKDAFARLLLRTIRDLVEA
ncbi:MAG: phosphopantothenoylcysteine decarboxylase [Phycisphaerales bacterium]|nr:phosphopantothenoylcysteine decarboxylase [Phycisphaerales bacterium]